MTASPRSSSSLGSSFIARVGLMAALALIFSYVEAIIPYSASLPGIKLGIANVVTLVALYKFGVKDAVAISVIRIVIAGLLFNGLFGMIYSLAGAALSLAGMIALKRTELFSVAGVSMAAGVLHNRLRFDRGLAHLLLLPDADVQRDSCRHTRWNCVDDNNQVYKVNRSLYVWD